MEPLDAHLQGGGGREQVRVSATGVIDELLFDPLTISARQQSGVFARHDALNIAAAVEVLVERQPALFHTAVVA